MAGERAKMEAAAAALKATFDRAEIPPRFQDARLSDFHESPKILAAVESAIREGKSMLIHGSVGSGKTHLAYAILASQLQDGIPGLAIEVPDLMARLKRSFGDNVEQEQVIVQARRAPILVLDDLGVEMEGEWQREVVYRIVDWRWKYGTPTIATSNFDPAKLSDRIGPRVVSRLNEIEIQFTGSLTADRRRISHVRVVK